MFDLTSPTVAIVGYTVLWAGLLVVIMAATILSRHATVGLLTAYGLTLVVFNIGGLVHLLPYYDHYSDPYLASWGYSKETVARGFEINVLGLAGIAVGAVLTNALVDKNRNRVRSSSISPPALLFACKTLISVGVVAYAIQRVGIEVPGVAAVLGGAQNALMIGLFGLIFYFSIRRQKTAMLVASCAAIAVSPVLNALLNGYLADGVSAALVALSFYLAFGRSGIGKLLRTTLILLAVIYLAVISAVTWLEIRGAVREAVFGGKSFAEAVGSGYDAMSSSTAFNTGSQKHLLMLDTRLDHNVTLGKAGEYLEANPWLHTNGDTLLLSFVGWVPRAVWPGKPERGGSATLTAYTDKQSGSRVSFATGPIFDLLVDFGYWGVFLGMSVYGGLLRYFDIRCARLFRNGNILDIAPIFMAMMPVITYSNTLFFVVNGAISAFLVGVIVRYFTLRQLSRRFRRQLRTVTANP